MALLHTLYLCQSTWTQERTRVDVQAMSYRTIAPSHSFETIVCKMQCPVVSPLGSITLLLVPLTKELLLLLDKRSDQ
jgi:hypothetical protein